MLSFKGLFASCVVVVSVACAGPVSSVDDPKNIAASTQVRSIVAAPAGDLQKAVDGQTRLALNLYRELVKGHSDSVFLSPHSIGVALSMTSAGARGNTAKEFDTVLGSTLAGSAHHQAMNDLDAQLNARGANAKAADGKPFRLKSTNQLFAQNGFPFEMAFLDTLAVDYGANVRLMDFVKAAEPSRLTINDWVAQRTEDRIKDLLPVGIIDDSTRLVLVNAIYFNAAWKIPFEPSRTANRNFTTVGGTVQSVPTMRESLLHARAAVVNGTEVVELPYDGEELSMLLVVPAAGSFASVESALSPAVLSSYVAALKNETLDLFMPKFELKNALRLKAPLMALGLQDAFGQADFSGMSREGGLQVSDVVHQAFVKVNEAGTEAAAATGVVVGVTSVPMSREVKVDRPFIFAVRDNATGAIVFLGRVTKI